MANEDAIDIVRRLCLHGEEGEEFYTDVADHLEICFHNLFLEQEIVTMQQTIALNKVRWQVFQERMAKKYDKV